MPTNRESTAAGYDATAEAYAARYAGELDHKPLDRALLRAFAHEAGATSDPSTLMVADVGCGPGHIARFLSRQGLPVCCVDLSPAMCAIARRLNPGAHVHQASMDAIPVPDAAWSGIVAFYALCHVAGSELPVVLREFARVLRPEGMVLVAFHAGDEVRHADELLGVPVDLDFHFHTTSKVAELLDDAGFEVTAVMERVAYQPWEVATRRAYIQARKRE
ncbi:MAG: class I SAM-dependent methyltransferase [Candidatus Dormibacteraeota bacterium]|nr:class I SAM-dependent methyltransferase [Candidatus Dormibacteraeota bacterium]MBV9525352.1 class I SAM-dependent methyltransferase [Candidatus Dormibacteraeota bacterium]